MEVTTRISRKWLERKTKHELASIIMANIDRIDIFAEERDGFRARLGMALEVPTPAPEDLLVWAALRASQAKVLEDHLEQCRAVLGPVASVPDAVAALVEEHARFKSALQSYARNPDLKTAVNALESR